MKSGVRKGKAGFSMIELMTVIGIIVVLAGIMVSALPAIQGRINRQSVQTFLAELETGLSAYQIDNGIYPQNKASGDRDGDGVKGASVLYKHLSGDWDLDGKLDSQEDGREVYVPKLTFLENQESKEKRSDAIGNDFAVIDVFSQPIRYLADPPNIDDARRKTINPTYDIWSVVDTDPSQSGTEVRWITNWGGQ